MVIEQCAEKIVCRCDGVHIACEVQVDVLHRDYLSISAACCAALDAEHGTERGLTESEYSLFAYLCHSLGKTYGNGGLALACGGGVDGGNERGSGRARAGQGSGAGQGGRRERESEAGAGAGRGREGGGLKAGGPGIEGREGGAGQGQAGGQVGRWAGR